MKSPRKNWKQEFVKLGAQLARTQDHLAKARDDAENFERHLKQAHVDMELAQNTIREVRATNKAIQASVDERIRIATKEAEHEISRLENRVNSDAAFIERKRMEHVALKHVASEFRSLIIDGIRGTGGTSKFITTAEIGAEFDKKD
jgi:chromosome segregation ATPase